MAGQRNVGCVEEESMRVNTSALRADYGEDVTTTDADLDSLDHLAAMRECLCDGIEHRVEGLGPQAYCGTPEPVDRRDDPTGDDVAPDAPGAWAYPRGRRD
jgi:hypothetical protein